MIEKLKLLKLLKSLFKNDDINNAFDDELKKFLEKINPYCAPNALVVWLADEILERDGKLYRTAEKNVRFTGSY